MRDALLHVVRVNRPALELFHVRADSDAIQLHDFRIPFAAALQIGAQERLHLLYAGRAGVREVVDSEDCQDYRSKPDKTAHAETSRSGKTTVTIRDDCRLAGHKVARGSPPAWGRNHAVDARNVSRAAFRYPVCT